MNNLVLYIILIFFTSSTLISQTNLVPNPSFEDTISCPIGTAQFSSIANWFSPTAATPDYYNTCYGVLPPGAFGAGIPANDWGYQEAHTGNAYAGLATYYIDPNLNEYREYIAIKLTEELEPSKTYYWCFHVSLTDSVEYYSNNMGIALTNNFYQDLSTESLIPLNVYGNYESQMDNYTQWIPIGGSFVANGGEQYLYIGNFFTDNETETTKFQENDRGGPAAGYFIDDVYLGLEPCLTPSITIPNVFTPNKDGINDEFYTLDIGLKDKQMIILNRWGNIVFEGNNDERWNGEDKGGNRCTEGVYFVKISYTNILSNKTEH